MSRIKHRYYPVSIACFLALLFVSSALLAKETKPEEKNVSAMQVALGEKLFFDPRLSEPAGQSCATCHSPRQGFADPRAMAPISEGAVTGRFGNRNAPSIGYIAFTPKFHFNKEESLWVGGLFLDGRASTMTDQVAGPLLNPLEMNNPDKTSVVEKVRHASYASLFEKVYGEGSLAETHKAFDYIGQAIVAFEQSERFSPFTSKYDYYLKGQLELTAQEKRGLEIFEREDKGNCAACHPSALSKDGNLPLFTDYTYDNLGVPRNENSPFYKQEKAHNPDGTDYIDSGLASTTHSAEDAGKFKVPTLRNVALTAPYMHNGVFKTLREVVEFYNSRDIDDKWRVPEVSENVNGDELGDLKLSEQEIDDLIAFMKTLSDGYGN